MADISKIKLPDNTEYDIKDKTSGYITGMTILSYGSSTWDDFITAYNAKKVVYCRASSNSNPASGTQTRLAFMAYVNNAETPTNVEFQYYRSVSSHSDSQQGDQVYVYKLDKTAGWTVTVREAYSKIAVTSPVAKSYSSGTITLSHADSGVTAKTTQALYPFKVDAKGHITEVGTAVTIPNGFANVKVGSTTIEADTTTDTLELIAGNNITLTPDATNDTVTIAASGGSSVSPYTSNPAMDGTASAGSSNDYARGDHVHPSDTSKQDTLVSGTNIKTINNTSLLGSGNITVGGVENFYITVTYNDQDGVYETDKTLTEIGAAYEDGKNLYVLDSNDHYNDVGDSPVELESNLIAPLFGKSDGGAYYFDCAAVYANDGYHITYYLPDDEDGIAYLDIYPTANRDFPIELSYSSTVGGYVINKTYQQLYHAWLGHENLYIVDNEVLQQGESNIIPCVSFYADDGIVNFSSVNGSTVHLLQVYEQRSEVSYTYFSLNSVTQNETTNNLNLPVLFSASSSTSTITTEAKKSSSYFYYNPSTHALQTGGTINSYTLREACSKSVDTVISVGSSSTALPTSAAVASYVASHGGGSTTIRRWSSS